MYLLADFLDVSFKKLHIFANKMVGRLPYKQDVGGSNPSLPTSNPEKLISNQLTAGEKYQNTFPDFSCLNFWN